MAITISGSAKTITLDTSTTFAVKDVYDACVDWACQSGNMQYLLPMTGTGKSALGGGVYTDSIYSINNGYKIKPSGYAADTQVKLTGTLITSDSSNYAIAPTSGSPVQWYVQATTAATIVATSSGSGLSTEEHDKLFAVAQDVWDKPTSAVTTSGTMGTVIKNNVPLIPATL